MAASNYGYFSGSTKCWNLELGSGSKNQEKINKKLECLRLVIWPLKKSKMAAANSGYFSVGTKWWNFDLWNGSKNQEKINKKIGMSEVSDMATEKIQDGCRQ